MHFSAKVGEKTIKSFPAVRNMNSGVTYRRFNNFCKERGYTVRVETSASFGFLGWANDAGELVALVQVNAEDR